LRPIVIAATSHPLPHPFFSEKKAERETPFSRWARGNRRRLRATSVGRSKHGAARSRRVNPMESSSRFLYARAILRPPPRPPSSSPMPDCDGWRADAEEEEPSPLVLQERERSRRACLKALLLLGVLFIDGDAAVEANAWAAFLETRNALTYF